MTASISQVESWRASIKRLRRRGRGLLNYVLAHLLGTPTAKRLPLAMDTHRVLVVRLNKRLGNILFLTPMLQALHVGLPRATIDILIRDQRQAALLSNLPGVRHIYVQPTSLRAMGSVLSALRRQHYDLIIDPSTNSTSDRVAVALIGARQRLGFASEDQWLRLTHAAAYPASRHQAKQGIALLSGGIADVDFGHWPHLAVHPDAAAQAAAQSHWQQVLADTAPAPVIGFFTGATGAKRLDNAWWRAWLDHMRARAPAARLLQILPPGADSARLYADGDAVQITELDVLAALMTRLAVFIAADSGPMHLAAASAVPTVGLFKATSATAYAPLGPGCTTLKKDELTPARAAEAVSTRLPQCRQLKRA